MKVSVLIPFYNQERYVDQTLGSVLSQQTDFDFEVLVGDDGSTDGTWSKIQEWRERYPEKIRCFLQDRDPDVKHDPFERVSAHKAFLIQQAQGQYFCFLDGDDYYIDPIKLQTQVDILDDPKNRDCVGCGHNVYLRYEPRGVEQPQIALNCKSQKISPAMYLTTWYFHSSSLLFRNLFPKPLDNPDLIQFFDDSIITAYLLKFGKIYFHAEVMSVYRICPASCTNSYDQNEKLLQGVGYLDISTKVVPEFRWYFYICHFANAKIYNYLDNISPELREKFLLLGTRDHFSHVLEVLAYRDKSAVGKYCYRQRVWYYRWASYWLLVFYKIRKHIGIGYY